MYHLTTIIVRVFELEILDCALANGFASGLFVHE